MKTNDIKLEAFNDCPGAEVIQQYLSTYKLWRSLQVVDVDQASFYSNQRDTLVLALGKAKAEVKIALALGTMAVRFKVDEFTWQFIDGMYIVRLWWD